ncbi:hypothetical protein PsorP6_016539 [Peronosclerospora sorghi]|uniref:Uncharacterized protein n=1 Tax=Peronosclerospora sorghi TaxID=230839 RepID=A0ACC0VPY4_9STRA|nr:hypothetical protein PsorP6_016539 [Peronosclerospora sorghi]
MERTQSLPMSKMSSVSLPISPTSPSSIMSRRRRVRNPCVKFFSALKKKRQFDVFVFDDDTILNRPVEAWPAWDALISFYSTGFPLQ